MKKSRKNHLLLRQVAGLVLIALISCWACEKQPTQEAALLELFQKEKKLQCDLLSMKDSITFAWDSVNHLLAEAIPPDMPQEEQANLLKVRNANLIRMFQSFDDFDETVKAAVAKTEKLDQEMTQRILVLKQASNDLESQKMLLFKEIHQSKGEDELARLKSINQAILAQDCS